MEHQDPEGLPEDLPQEWDEAASLMAECPHPWWDLDFLADDGLGCSTCGDSWQGDQLVDAVLVVWNSAKMALDHQGGRVVALEEVLRRTLHLLRCDACGEWGAQQEWLDLGHDVAACPDHVGDVLRAMSTVEDALEPSLLRARSWVGSATIAADATLEGRWRLERNLLAFPGLCSEAEPDDDQALERAVELPPLLAAALRLPSRVSLRVVAAQVASVIDVAPPRSRPSAAFLVGLAAESMRALDDWRKAHQGQPSGEEVEDLAGQAADNALPRAHLVRLALVGDLLDSESVSGEGDPALLEGLLGMVGSRGAEVLISAIDSSGTTGLPATAR